MCVCVCMCVRVICVSFCRHQVVATERGSPLPSPHVPAISMWQCCSSCTSSLFPPHPLGLMSCHFLCHYTLPVHSYLFQCYACSHPGCYLLCFLECCFFVTCSFIFIPSLYHSVMFTFPVLFARSFHMYAISMLLTLEVLPGDCWVWCNP